MLGFRTRFAPRSVLFENRGAYGEVITASVELLSCESASDIWCCVLSDSVMCECPTSGAEASWVGGAKSASLIGRFKPKKHTALIGQFKLYDDRGLINVY